MGCYLKNSNPLGLNNYLSSYLNLKKPDCSLVSEDGYEIPIHKEIMYQTKQMREIVNSVTQLHCCGKLEIFCPSLLNEEIEHIVQFLYNGEIVCADQNIANQTFDNLTKVFGFPFTNWSNTSEPSQALLIQPPLKIKLETVDNTDLDFNVEFDGNSERGGYYEQDNFIYNDDKSGFIGHTDEYETGVAYTDFNESEILERIKEGKERKKKNFDSWNHSISCPICGKKVAHRNNLKRHILRRHNESDLAIIENSPDLKPIKYHICHVCGYKSSVKSNLKKHVANKHGEAELENMGVVEYGEPPQYHNCHICSYKTSFKQNLKKHIVTQHGEDELQNMEVMDYDANEDQTEFSCQFCDKSYKFKGDLTRHIILKHTEDDFENSEEKDVDPIGTNTESNAEEKPGANQGLENTGNGNNPGDSNQEIKELDNLLAPLPSQMELPFTCHHCGVGCSHKGNLKRHILTKHTNLSKEEKRRLSGTIRKDGKESTPGRKRYGPDYEKLKNASDQKSGVCHLCGEYFTYLARHIMYTHETEKPWKCEHCDFAHALKAGLLAHSKGCQPKESSYKVCHLCGYKTVYNAMLKVHIESKHEKKKRFKCNICDAGFYENTKLQRHIRGTHLQEKPHICKICGMGFKESPRLKTHILTIHQGIKFSCDICGKEYLDRKGLNRHKQNVHGNVKEEI